MEKVFSISVQVLIIGTTAGVLGIFALCLLAIAEPTKRFLSNLFKDSINKLSGRTQRVDQFYVDFDRLLDSYNSALDSINRQNAIIKVMLTRLEEVERKARK